MAWETISREGPTPAGKLPPFAVAVTKRKLRGNAGYILITIGGGLAKAVGLIDAEHRVDLMVGSGSDDGKLAVAAAAGGAYVARRRGKKAPACYAISINRASAEGLFAWEFPPFVRDELAPVRPEGGPTMVVFTATDEMLDADD